MKTTFNLQEYKDLARLTNAEGMVLLKNDGQLLPLAKGTKIALFGRSQLNYYKSGTGSGGAVNTEYVTGILDALQADDTYQLNQRLLDTYQAWVEEHPFDVGNGWATEPWSQLEMPLSMDLVQEAAVTSDVAVIIIGRLAGEDRDNAAVSGSYLLTVEEEQMLELVCKQFSKTVVLLNTGNIIDMKWVDKYQPSSVLYVWQGGQEGGSAVLDVLKGIVSPSGKLADTIAYDIEDYPSTPYFGDPDRNLYVEDIFVGYRYFETFAADKVMYPFGYGLSYTEFALEAAGFTYINGIVTVQCKVTNVGHYKGKEVVQLYCQAPQGKLGKAARVLCGFAKTKELQPGESQLVEISCDEYVMASYDDSGLTGHAYAYCLEAGEYLFHLGNSIRNTSVVGSFRLEDCKVLQQLKQAMAPTVAFERMKAVATADGVALGKENVPLRQYDPMDIVKVNRPQDMPITGDLGYKLEDVRSGKVSLEQFVAQLSAHDLMCMVRGEGMCSPKVTPGTAGAFGGVTKSLRDFGVPLGCCADGPSGIRMDCGTIAFAMPNGTCQACCFNEELVEELYEMEALELRKNRIDTLLGPGINIHRNPLNGRNFEYFSEDPLLTGRMVVAQLKGMHKYHVTGTVKHFACNNQEYRRSFAEGIVSERAIREIYLKPFEMCVKEGDAYCIMSTYGPVNGFWTASSYDLLTRILRGEWNYDGLVMTDWWAKGNEEGGEGTLSQVSAQVRSQNDLNMVNADADTNSNGDDLVEGLASGKVTLGELQRTAMNICRVLMRMPAMWHSLGQDDELDQEMKRILSEEENASQDIINLEMDENNRIDSSAIPTEKGRQAILCIRRNQMGRYKMRFKLRVTTENPLAQLPVSITKDRELLTTISLRGDENEWKEFELDLGEIFNTYFYMKFFFGQNGMEISDICCELYEAY